MNTMVTLTEVHDWVRNAQHGDQLVYHTGYLANDRDPQRTEDKDRAVALNAIANRLHDALEQSRVTLCQRKVGDMRYVYVAIRTEYIK